MVMSGQLHDPSALCLNKKLLYVRAGAAGESHWGEGWGKSCLVPYIPVHYWMKTGILISYLPHSAVLESLLDSYTLQEQYSYHHSCTVDNTKLSCSTAPYSLQDTGKFSHSCTSHRWHISCRTLDLGL
jgi:hypothetical protein